MSFFVRTASDDPSLANAVRAAVTEIDGRLPVTGVRWMRTQVNDSIYVRRLIATLAAGFGLLATLLAALGLYGVLSYSTARRTSEIGVRMALGATRSAIVRLVLRDLAWITLWGVGIGAPCAIVAGRWIRSQLFGVSPWDATTIAVAAVLLCGVALAAGYLPARKASATDPLRALRHD
jgi:ABC-type antimicrobial peptide transport system permease subunit